MRNKKKILSHSFYLQALVMKMWSLRLMLRHLFLGCLDTELWGSVNGSFLEMNQYTDKLKLPEQYAWGHFGYQWGYFVRCQELDLGSWLKTAPPLGMEDPQDTVTPQRFKQTEYGMHEQLIQSQPPARFPWIKNRNINSRLLRCSNSN